MVLDDDGVSARIYWRVIYNKSQKVLQLFDNHQEFRQEAEVRMYVGHGAQF